MKSKILLLSNLQNESLQEDLFLKEYLSNEFEITIYHPLECATIENNTDIILIRNIWLTSEYEDEWEKIKQRLIRKKLLTYNPLSGSGDSQGKDYLVKLFQQNYPVIPSTNNLKDMTNLPQSNWYIFKPNNGGSGVGVRKVNQAELENSYQATDIIQPYIDFSYELSFYYIDNILQHTLYAPDKNNRWDLKEFQSSVEDKKFAQQFIDWNTLPYGIQRIDACRLPNGQLLLMEIEDLCPYLSLLEIPTGLRENFLQNLLTSLKKKL